MKHPLLGSLSLQSLLTLPPDFISPFFLIGKQYLAYLFSLPKWIWIQSENLSAIFCVGFKLVWRETK